ncbi:MAG TPA: YceI family protein [Gaiellaceae bacterium]|nr:YceI family protein [Gaiellaceae bacterium]
MTTTAVPSTITGTWQLDPVHSSVGFEVPYLVGTFKGQFRETDARLSLSERGAGLSGTAKVASVDVKDENLAAHLQSPDFFDAERHPELSFTAHDVDLDGESVSARGELTIKGVTKPVEVTGRITDTLVDGYGRERIGLVLSTTVDRHDFGVSWNMPLPSGGPAVGDEVTIVAELYFVKAA